MRGDLPAYRPQRRNNVPTEIAQSADLYPARAEKTGLGPAASVARRPMIRSLSAQRSPGSQAFQFVRMVTSGLNAGIIRCTGRTQN